MAAPNLLKNKLVFVVIGALCAACGPTASAPEGPEGSGGSAGPGPGTPGWCETASTCIDVCLCTVGDPNDCASVCQDPGGSGGSGGPGPGGSGGAGGGVGGSGGASGGSGGAGGGPGGSGGIGPVGQGGFGGEATGPLRAFPGAEGFGAKTKGGRGGDVYHVTNLKDSGSGSLREGIESANGPRTIVFEVGGTIKLKKTLVIDNDYITIAGQTAPGDGITIAERSVDIKNARDIIVRFIRIRRGDLDVRAGGRPTSSRGLDTVSIDDSRNIIFDHVSLSWSCDEIFGIVQNENVTIQWSIISEPLGDPPLHPYGDRHAFGLNNSANTLSFHHSLVANYVMRGPQFEANDARNSQGYDVYMEAVNNVLFNYKESGSRYTHGIEDNPSAASNIDFRFHFRSNMYIASEEFWKWKPEIEIETKHSFADRLKVHVAGNIGPHRPDGLGDEWSLVFTDDSNIRQASSEVQSQMSDAPLFSPDVPITETSAQEAYNQVLAQAGFSTKRDSVDERVIQEVINRPLRRLPPLPGGRGRLARAAVGHARDRRRPRRHGRRLGARQRPRPDERERPQRRPGRRSIHEPRGIPGVRRLGTVRPTSAGARPPSSRAPRRPSITTTTTVVTPSAPTTWST